MNLSRNWQLFLLGFVCAGIGAIQMPACSASSEPPPLDPALAVAKFFCLQEAPKRGFDPKLCELPETLRPYVEDALRERLASLDKPGSFVGTAGVREVPAPCPPFADSPAPPPPGTPSGGAGAQ